MRTALMPKTRGGAAVTTPRRRRVTPRQYRAAFAARVRQARTSARYPIDEMALLLGITRDTYTKYEGRGASLMPHNLIVPFCLACRVSVEWLLTGIGPTRSRWSPKMLSSSKMLIEKAWAPSQTMSIFDWRKT
jgi:hypothetical protein